MGNYGNDIRTFVSPSMGFQATSMLDELCTLDVLPQRKLTHSLKPLCSTRMRNTLNTVHAKKKKAWVSTYVYTICWKNETRFYHFCRRPRRACAPCSAPTSTRDLRAERIPCCCRSCRSVVGRQASAVENASTWNGRRRRGRRVFEFKNITTEYIKKYWTRTRTKTRTPPPHTRSIVENLSAVIIFRIGPCRDAHACTDDDDDDDDDAFIARLIVSDVDDCVVGRGWLADKSGEKREKKKRKPIFFDFRLAPFVRRSVAYAKRRRNDIRVSRPRNVLSRDMPRRSRLWRPNAVTRHKSQESSRQPASQPAS